MLAGGGKLLLQLPQILLERLHRHVVDRLIAATNADRLVEVELAVLQLAHLGQALAQGVEPGGLRLQLAQACRQGVDLGLRSALRLRKLGLLLRDLGLQRGIGHHAGGGACTDANQHAQAQYRHQHHHRSIRGKALELSGQPLGPGLARFDYDFL